MTICYIIYKAFYSENLLKKIHMCTKKQLKNVITQEWKCTGNQKEGKQAGVGRFML